MTEAPPTRSEPATSERWAGVAERGSMLGIRLAGAVYRWLGRRVTLLLLKPVTLYFLLADRRARAGSSDYLETLWAAPGGRAALGGRRPTWRSSWKHLDEFAENLVDRMVLWSGGADRLRFEHAGSEHLFRLAAEKRGAILIGSHLGSYDMSRVLATRYGLTLNVVMFTERAGRIMAFFRQLDPESAINIVAMDPTSVRTGFEVRAAIERGELVGILGDRVPPGGEEHAREMPFLGRPASFPLSPFLLAAVLGAPVFSSVCVRTAPATYDTVVTPLGEGGRVPRREQPERAGQLLAAYVESLERACVATPYQWFNFFPFWNDGTWNDAPRASGATS